MYIPTKCNYKLPEYKSVTAYKYLKIFAKFGRILLPFSGFLKSFLIYIQYTYIPIKFHVSLTIKRGN